MARLLTCDIVDNPNLITREIAPIVKAEVIYERLHPAHHYRTIIKLLRKHMEGIRTVEMAALNSFAHLLQDERHVVKIYVFDGMEMKSTPIPAAVYMFKQFKKKWPHSHRLSVPKQLRRCVRH